MRRKISWAGLLLAACTGCAHHARASVLDAARASRCEDAAWFASVAPSTPVDDGLRVVVSAPASFVLTGAGYAVDVGALVTVGVTAGAVACAPIAAIEAALGGGDLGGECFSAVAGGIIGSGELPGAGDALGRATRTWRCRDHVPRSEEARAVAACYLARDWPADRWLASRALAPLRNRRFRACLPARELRRVDRALAELDGDPAEPENTGTSAGDGAE